MNNISSNDVISALIAGTISFVLSFVLNIYEHLEQLQKDLDDDMDRGDINYLFLFFLWSVKSIISFGFGGLVFFALLHFFPNINMIFAYMISGFVSLNAIGFISVFRRVSSKKLEEKIDEL